MCWLVVYHEVVRTYSLLAGGFFALGVAAWRSCVAAQNLRLERYKVGAELLDGKIHGHTARIAGALVLADYGRRNEERHRRAMIAFEAFLTHPPRFKGDHGEHKDGSVDYESHDIGKVIGIINRRNEDQRKWHRVGLSSLSPFAVNEAGDVDVDEDHEEWRLWRDAGGAIDLAYRPVTRSDLGTASATDR